VCHFCGTLITRIESPEAEVEAIAELHAAITDANDDKARARLLANGPLPDDRDVLIDAALRASQLMSPKDYADETPHAAVRRVEAVCMKLRVLAAGDPVADRGVHELEKKLAAFKHGAAQEEREGGKAVLVILLVGLGLFGLIAFGIWSAAR
jgi:hypothetical protein